MANISFYGSHNAAVAVENKGKIVLVLEVERFINYKNSGWAQYKVSYTRDFAMPIVLDFIKKEYGISKFDKCFYQNTDVINDGVFTYHHLEIPAKEYINCKHHEAHAAGTFYQSNYGRALIISFDGGGNDGLFNVYLGVRSKGVECIERLGIDLGFPYMIFGQYMKDIKMESALSDGNLVYPGKLMGLCAYGKVREEWLDTFKEFYYSKPDGINYVEKLKLVEDKLGFVFNVHERLEGELAYDIAATSQKAFEECFLETIQPYLDQYPNIPICVTGGCALNIILNTRLKMELNREVFVAPNPNDCGLAMGMLANHMKPEEPIDITYKGIPILDKNSYMTYVESQHAPKVTNEQLVQDLSNGLIIGVVRGNSEHGPRALGNRSIICNPAYPEMKDILNKKVKNREWYRPFAPVCRLEDVEKYFEFSGESRFMSFSPIVREEWREKLSSIVHVDNTARVQTVTKKQNEWLYNLITDFEKVSGIGVLLNTSFNVDGKPILSTYKDAFEVYQKTQMDRLVLDDFYFRYK